MSCLLKREEGGPGDGLLDRQCQLLSLWKPRCAVASAGADCRMVRSNVDICVVPCLPRVPVFFSFFLMSPSRVSGLEWRPVRMWPRLFVFISVCCRILPCGEVQSKGRDVMLACLHVGLDGRRMPCWSTTSHKDSVFSIAWAGRLVKNCCCLPQAWTLNPDPDFSISIVMSRKHH